MKPAKTQHVRTGAHSEADLILHHVDKADTRIEWRDLFPVTLVPVDVPGFVKVDCEVLLHTIDTTIAAIKARLHELVDSH